MKTAIGLFLFCLLSLAAVAQDSRPYEWYAATYPFMQHKGKTFTIESELRWPEGYQRVDSATLTPYQFWVSHLPLWYASRPVARVSGVALAAEKIACAIHLPWRTVRYYDYTIPLQLWFEFNFMRGDTTGFAWVPFEGDTITVARFLTGDPIAYRGRELQFRAADPKPLNDCTQDKCMDHCAKWTNFGSLAANAAEVDTTDIRPGDMLIATEDVPTKGRVWTVLTVLTNENGEKLYLVGTGCDFGCDFYIPLANDQKDYPWLTGEQLFALPADYPNWKFYRFQID